MKRILHRCRVLLFVVLAIAAAQAQTRETFTESIAAGSGTLNYSVEVFTFTCTVGNPPQPPDKPEPEAAIGPHNYTESFYSGFSYVASGVTTPLLGSAGTILNPEPGCGPANSVPVTTLFAAPVFPFKSQMAIPFTPSDISPTGGSASISSATPGLIYPKFQVQSIIYDTPGNLSSNGFTSSKTDGTATSIGSSFEAGTTTTYSISTGFLGLGSTISWSSGNSAEAGTSTSANQTITDATGVASTSNPSGPNTINHHQDLFIIWINPAVVVFQTGPDSVGYAQGTQLQTTGDPNPGQPEAYQDQVEVTAQAMMANAQGVTTVPLNILEPVKMPDGETLPGLATICANLNTTEYSAGKCTKADQCGCVPSDFAPILAQDPLLNFSSTESPLNADTSGANVCENPTPADSCRYVPVPTAPGSGVPVVELLEGPDDTGGVLPSNTFTQTNSSETTQTLSESDTYTVASSIEESFKFLGTGISITKANQWAWTNSESMGEINGYANSMTVTLSSSTVGCDQEIPIFEDTVFHTFVFSQPVGNSSCP